MAFTANYLQAVTYAARIDRKLVDNLWTEGVLGAGSLLVSERGAGTNMTVDVAAGVAVVEGDDQAFQGKYLCREQAVTTGVVISAAPGSGTRHDLVVLRVNDTNAGGPAGDDAVLAVVAGAGGDSTDPAVPDSALVLARVRVPTGTSSITNVLIDDLRVPSRLTHDVIPPGTITEAKLVDSAVATAKLANLSVTAAKIANTTITAGKLASNAVETAKISNLAVTEAKLATAVLSSEWANLAYGSGWGAPVSGTRMQYKRVGNEVRIVGGMRRSSGSAAMGTLPVGFRPASDALRYIFDDTISISTAGVITLNTIAGNPIERHVDFTLPAA